MKEINNLSKKETNDCGQLYHLLLEDIIKTEEGKKVLSNCDDLIRNACLYPNRIEIIKKRIETIRIENSVKFKEFFDWNSLFPEKITYYYTNDNLISGIIFNYYKDKENKIQKVFELWSAIHEYQQLLLHKYYWETEKKEDGVNSFYLLINKDNLNNKGKTEMDFINRLHELVDNENKPSSKGRIICKAKIDGYLFDVPPKLQYCNEFNKDKELTDKQFEAIRKYFRHWNILGDKETIKVNSITIF